MLIETYGVIVKKSEFLSYSAKNRIQNGGHMQGFWFSELQLQKKEYHIRNQHKKLHETVGIRKMRTERKIGFGNKVNFFNLTLTAHAPQYSRKRLAQVSSCASFGFPEF
jgi:hypothetical protein